MTPGEQFQHTSSVYAGTSLSQFWHSCSEQPTQLGGGHGWGCRCISTGLIAVAPRSVPGCRWCQTSGRSRQSRDWRCSSDRRRGGPAGSLCNYGGGSIVRNGLFQGSALGDIGEECALHVVWLVLFRRQHQAGWGQLTLPAPAAGGREGRPPGGGGGGGGGPPAAPGGGGGGGGGGGIVLCLPDERGLCVDEE